MKLARHFLGFSRGKYEVEEEEGKPLGGDKDEEEEEGGGDGEAESKKLVAPAKKEVADETDIGKSKKEEGGQEGAMDMILGPPLDTIEEEEAPAASPLPTSAEEETRTLK